MKVSPRRHRNQNRIRQKKHIQHYRYQVGHCLCKDFYSVPIQYPPQYQFQHDFSHSGKKYRECSLMGGTNFTVVAILSRSCRVCKVSQQTIWNNRLPYSIEVVYQLLQEFCIAKIRSIISPPSFQSQHNHTNNCLPILEGVVNMQ